MDRLLFVSGTYPVDFATANYGIFHRLRTFLEAAQAVTNSLDILFYVPAGIEISDTLSRKIEQDMAETWGITATALLCQTAQVSHQSKWSHYIAPMLSISHHPNYSSISGPQQVAGFDAALDRKPDAVLLFQLHAACPALFSKRPLPPVVFDLNDIDHVKFLRDLRQPPFWLGKLLYYPQLLSLMAGERKAIKLAKKTFVCSDVDTNYLTSKWHLPGVRTIPNGIAIPGTARKTPQSKKLLFIGSYTYAPNVAAAEFLITRIWPQVRAEIPEARLFIGGNKAERIPSFHESPENVEFLGFVPDLNALYDETQIVCCPILTGGGTRLKIVEAAAHGKAVVSTAVGAEGLDFEDGQEIIIRDSPEAFASACVELLHAPERCAAIGARAREKAARLYERSRIIAQIKDELSDVR